MNKGGVRPGAGRRPAEQRVTVPFRLSPKVAKDLRSTIPEKSRSNWVEGLIVKALKKYQQAL